MSSIDPTTLAGTPERETCRDILSRATTAGRISVDELARRERRLEEAATVGDLVKLVRDLPDGRIWADEAVAGKGRAYGSRGTRTPARTTTKKEAPRKKSGASSTVKKTFRKTMLMSGLTLAGGALLLTGVFTLVIPESPEHTQQTQQQEAARTEDGYWLTPEGTAEVFDWLDDYGADVQTVSITPTGATASVDAGAGRLDHVDFTARGAEPERKPSKAKPQGSAMEPNDLPGDALDAAVEQTQALFPDLQVTGIQLDRLGGYFNGIDVEDYARDIGIKVAPYAGAPDAFHVFWSADAKRPLGLSDSGAWGRADAEAAAKVRAKLPTVDAKAADAGQQMVDMLEYYGVRKVHSVTFGEHGGKTSAAVVTTERGARVALTIHPDRAPDARKDTRSTDTALADWKAVAKVDAAGLRKKVERAYSSVSVVHKKEYGDVVYVSGRAGVDGVPAVAKWKLDGMKPLPDAVQREFWFEP